MLVSIPGELLAIDYPLVIGCEFGRRGSSLREVSNSVLRALGTKLHVSCQQTYLFEETPGT